MSEYARERSIRSVRVLLQGGKKRKKEREKGKKSGAKKVRKSVCDSVYENSMPLIFACTNRSPLHQIERVSDNEVFDPTTKGFRIQNRRILYGTETTREIKREAKRLVSASQFQEEYLRVSFLTQTTLTSSTPKVAASSHYWFLQRFFPTMKSSTDGGWGLTMGFGRMLAG